MRALQCCCRLERSVLESVDDLAQAKQIGKAGKRTRPLFAQLLFAQLLFDCRGMCKLALACSPYVGPVNRNERSIAIRQHHQKLQNATAIDAGDNAKTSAFKRMPPPRNHH